MKKVAGTGGGNDVFFDHDGTHVVGAGGEGTGAGGQADGEPGGLDVVDVVEHESGDGDSAQEFLVGVPAAEFARKGDTRRQTAFRSETGQFGARQLHRPADEGAEARRTGWAFVLQGAQRQQVINAFLVRFNMAVYHRGRRAHAQMMGLPHHIQPLPCSWLGRRQEAADAVAEDFCAGAGKRIESGGTQAHEDIVIRQPADAGDVRNFRRPQRIELQRRLRRFQPAEQRLVPFDAILRMQAALQQ